MEEQKRKEQLAEMTGGLLCRCPGFQQMTRVECRGFDGVRFCYFACEDPNNPGQETRHPVGEPNNCRCTLGSQLDKTSVRVFEDEEATWGFARCLKLSGGLPEAPPLPRERRQTTMSFMPVALGVGALLWYVTTRGR